VQKKKTCAISHIGILTTALWTHVLSMFVCAVIHINHHTSLELRYGHADCAPWCRALIVSNYSLAFFSKKEQLFLCKLSYKYIDFFVVIYHCYF
jgi:hypothetical protein